MIYEIKGQQPSDPGQRNYQILKSPDKKHFYWNQKKFSKLVPTDVIFVVNKSGGEILYTELDAEEIPTTYKNSDDQTLFEDLGQSFQLTGEWENFVRLRIIATISSPKDWKWKTLGSSENTYLLGPHVSEKSAANNLERASQLLDLDQLPERGQDTLKLCIDELKSIANVSNTLSGPNKPSECDPADLFEVLKKYSDENVVFHSTERGAAYSISESEPGKFQTNRIDANEPVKISPDTYREKFASLSEHNGSLPFSGFTNTVAVKNTLIQSRVLSLTADRQTVVDVTDIDHRLQIFCEILENLKVAKTQDGPRLYKPAMLACVLDAINQGQLTENKISFDFIAPRFIEKMAELGETVTETNAAQPFYHLTGDLIWFHAVHNIHDLMDGGKAGPAAARTKVKYALLKETYWELLQDWSALSKARKTLEEKWFQSKNPISPHPSENLPMLTPDFLGQASKAIRETGLIYNDNILRRFVVSVLTKPFVLLTGTSGTGKTQLALKFAQWLVGDDGYELIPVGADWTDNRQVLGHYNPFEAKFISTRALDLILRARESPDTPFFLILDEMNLSHVERYFADFLSAMESGDSISLHRNGNQVETTRGTHVDEEVKLPKNLFVIGTVNIDETTYMFSPKVLDRANVIEFALTKGDLDDYLDSSGSKLAEPSPAPSSFCKSFVAFHQQPRSRESLKTSLSGDLATTQKILTDFFLLLEGSGLEFGFRTPSEFLRYCEIDHNLTSDGAWNRDLACDIQILQKILPKLHGSRRRIESLLVGLASYSSDGNLDHAQKYSTGQSSPSHFQLDQETPRFPLSFAKLKKMIGVVQRDQFVSFIQ